MAILALAPVLSAAGSVEMRHQRFMAQGGATWRQGGEERIDGAGCDAIGHVDGIRGSFASRTAGTVRFAQLPGLDVDLVEVTRGVGGIVALTAGSMSTMGVLLGDELADRLGIEVGDVVRLAGREVTVAGIVHVPWPDDPMQSSVVVVRPLVDAPLFDACVAAASTWSGDVRPLLAATLVGASADDRAPTRVNARLGETPDFRAELVETRWWTAPLVAVVLMAVAAFAVGARRALPRSAFANLGVPLVDQTVVALFEVALVLPALVLLQSAAGVWMATALHTAELRRWFVVVVMAVVCSSVLGQLIGLLASAPMGGRRRLLRRFKDRL